MSKYTVHPLADVHSKEIGSDTVVWQYSIILHGAVIGKNCNINAFTFIENDVSLGNNVTLKCGVQLWDGIKVHDNVFIGPNATFTNDLNPRSKKIPKSFCKTIVHEGASIGANATIVGGISIGRYAMIGAGSVVTKDVPDFALVYGNPAKEIGHVCICGHKIENLKCQSCDIQFEIINNKLCLK